MKVSHTSALFALGLYGSGALAQNTSTTSSSSALPTVDLGYNIQRATNYNDTGDFYAFSNIRYAASPTGQNRFCAPQPPVRNRSEVQDGSIERFCYQASPGWAGIAADFIPKYLAGQTEFNTSSFTNVSDPNAGTNSGASEDCLFLDVAVPKGIFNAAGKGYGAPVLVWIYGGGYTMGTKTQSYDPAGLLNSSKEDGGEGVVYVALNYRLGAFGFLSGPSFGQVDQPNAGLYDQRFALEWIQDNIAKFGGDPNRVTVFGESAGGGSIMHQISAYGGSKAAPFQQAIPQSPGYFPLASNSQQEEIYQEYLKRLNVTTLDEARDLSSEELQAANLAQVVDSFYGGFTFGPAPDGDFVTALPVRMFAQGKFDKSVRIMVGHNADEGLLFTSPFIQNDTTFENLVTTVTPSIKASPSTLDYVTQVLYPSIFDGTHGYKDQIGRAKTYLGDGVIYSNANAFSKAYGNSSYAYQFSVPPALHADDIPYTFYPTQPSGVMNASLAMTMQKYFTSFAMSGDPNGRGLTDFAEYGGNGTVLDFNVTNISHIKDMTANKRTAWWQQVLYV